MNIPTLKPGKDPGNDQDKNKGKTQRPNSFDYYLYNSQFVDIGLGSDDFDFEDTNNMTDNSNDEPTNFDDNSLNDQDSALPDQEEDDLITFPGGSNNNENNVPSNETRPDQNERTISQVRQGRPRQRNDQISERTKKFKKDYHSLFTNRKKIKKDYIIQIHSQILMEKYGIKKMTRDEYRNIDTYFINYTTSREKVLSILTKEKDFIMKNILKDNF